MSLITTSPYAIIPTEFTLSDVSYVQFFDANPQNDNMRAMHFKPDGTKMYLMGTWPTTIPYSVFEYDLSTPWDLSTASFPNTSPLQKLYVGNIDSNAPSLYIRNDGLKLYHAGNYNQKLQEYDLSVAWDITTASHLQSSTIDHSGIDTGSNEMFAKPDGTKMYVVGINTNSIMEFDLSTPWDVSTASYLQNFVIAEDSQLNGIFFKADGTKLYTCGYTNDTIYEYNLSPAWDISSRSLVQGYSVSIQTGYPASVFIMPDGTKMFVLDALQDRVHEYNLT